MIASLSKRVGKICFVGRYDPFIRARRDFSEIVGLSQSEKRAMRETKRAQLKQQLKTHAPPSGMGLGWLALALLTGGGVAAYGIGHLINYGEDNKLTEIYRGSAFEACVLAIDNLVFEPFKQPAHQKLLPDWPMPGIPPDMPQPLVLVLDLEDTLVTSKWDRTHGWRMCKRPGVEKFLFDLCRYYEIVVFTPSVSGIADPTITALDKDGYIMHRLYRDSTHFVNGHHVKDLSTLNRPIEKILIIDDDPKGYSLQPENGIHIKPFTDPTDKHDTALDDIKPFLEALAVERISNVPEVLRSYGSHEADKLAAEHQRRVTAVKARQFEDAQKGLGGFIRGRQGQKAGLAPVPPASSIPSSADIIKKGISAQKEDDPVVPQVQRKKGRLWQTFAVDPKEQEERQKEKMAEWEKVMQEMTLERQKRESA